MKVFPKIHFVNILPTQKIEKTLTEKQVIMGFCTWKSHNDCQIFILNKKAVFATVLHELTHWAIQISLRSKSDTVHKIHDRCWRFCTRFYCKYIATFSLGEWEQHQIKTRKVRCDEMARSDGIFQSFKFLIL